MPWLVHNSRPMETKTAAKMRNFPFKLTTISAVFSLAFLANCSEENSTNPVPHDDGTNNNASISCSTETLKDSSGIKITCGGDSTGVVHNGKNGNPGEAGRNGTNGESCTAVTLADNSGLKIICGGDSIGVVLNGKSESKESSEKEHSKNDIVKGNDGTSCSAIPLADTSGYKVLCGTDSVGVIHNGQPGKQGLQGDKGDGCSISQNKYNGLVTITCGETSVSIDFGESAAPQVYEISLDEIIGFAQELQQFPSGSTVELYELYEDTFKPTGTKYTSTISNDDGSYIFYNVNLKSRYALFKAIGSNYLVALIDLKDRNSVNINRLTHLEFERIIYLMKSGKTMAEAKQQADAEIMEAFYMEAFPENAEDLNIYGPKNGDSSLIALNKLTEIAYSYDERSYPIDNDSDHDKKISLTAYLDTLANDFKEDGEWNDDKLKWKIAQSLQPRKTGAGNIQPVENSYGKKVVEHMNDFWNQVYSLGSCTSNQNGVVKIVEKISDGFVCTNHDIWGSDNIYGFAWTQANNREKDTYNHGSVRPFCTIGRS